MKIRLAAATLGVVMSATLLIGCTSDDEDQGSDTAATSDGQATESTAAPDTEVTPKKPDHEPVRGADDAAVEETVRAFIPQWAAFSPWDFGDPKADYFERWESMATDDYGMQQFRSFDANWSWTWTDEIKAYNAKVDRIGDITVTGDTAVASNVVVTRHLLPILGRASDDRTETKVYTIRLVVDENDYPKVSGVTSIGDSNDDTPRDN